MKSTICITALLLLCSSLVWGQIGTATVQYSGACPQGSAECTVTLKTPVSSPMGAAIAGRIGSPTLQNVCPYVSATTNLGDALTALPSTIQFKTFQNSGMLVSLTTTLGVTSITVKRGCTKADNWSFFIIMIPYSNGSLVLDDAEGQTLAETEYWNGVVLNLASGNDQVIETCVCGPDILSVSPDSWLPSYFEDHLAISVPPTMPVFSTVPVYYGKTATTGITSGIAVGFVPST